MKQIRVHFLPQFIAEHELADRTVIVVDLLRASTTIVAALANGAREVWPAVEIEQTVAQAKKFSRQEILLGGERGGEQIEGFDLGNSPTEFTPDVVFNKRVLFTTTNGTRAIEHARLARRVVIGAMVNLSAVVVSIESAPAVDVLCAGTAGHVTREDILCAGAIVEALAAAGRWSTDADAGRARGEWQELLTAAAAANRPLTDQLADELSRTQGGKNLLAIGHGFDLAECAAIDRYDVVPEVDRTSGRIHLP